MPLWSVCGFCYSFITNQKSQNHHPVRPVLQNPALFPPDRRPFLRHQAVFCLDAWAGVRSGLNRRTGWCGPPKPWPPRLHRLLSPESPPEALPPSHRHLLPHRRCPCPLRPADNPPRKVLVVPHHRRRQIILISLRFIVFSQSPGSPPHRRIPDNPLNAPKGSGSSAFSFLLFLPWLPCGPSFLSPSSSRLPPFSPNPW